MKKHLLLGIFLLAAGALPLQAREVWNNYWGYGFSYPKSWSGISFQDITGIGTSAVYVDSYYGTFAFNDIGFLRNNAPFYVYKGAVSFTNSEFRNNNSTALYLSNYNGNTISALRNVEFSGNHTANNGAAIASLVQDSTYQKAGLCAFEQVKFSNNRADNNGGAVWLAHTEQVMQNVSFVNNSALKGGALYAENDLSIIGGNISFTGNSATQGGAIYANGALTLRAENGNITFSDNTGFGIYMGSGLAVNLQTTDSGNIIFNDTFGGTSQANVSGSGTVFFQKDLGSKTIRLDSGAISLNTALAWSNLTLQVNSGNLNMANNSLENQRIGNLVLNGNLHLVPDVDMVAGTMDTLQVTTASGSGHIVVDAFNILSSEPNKTTTVNFITEAGKNRVQLPQTVYDNIYAYETSYDASAGTVTFIPNELVVDGGTDNVKSFAPDVTFQPFLAYTTLLQLKNNMDLRRQDKQAAILQYGDMHSGHYVTPYMDTVSSKFNNQAEGKSQMQGLRVGAYSGNLEWFNETNAVAEGYADIHHYNMDYEGKSVSGQNYQLGGSIYLYGYSWFMGATVQGTFITRSGFVSGTSWAGGAFGHVGAHWDVRGAELFIQPNISYSYHFLPQGKEVVYRGATLASKAVQQGQMKAGLEVIKIYSDQWRAHVGGYFVNETFNAPVFYADGEKLPSFEQNAGGEIVAGANYAAEEWELAAQLKIYTGDNSGISLDMSILF